MRFSRTVSPDFFPNKYFAASVIDGGACMPAPTYAPAAPSTAAARKITMSLRMPLSYRSAARDQ